MRQKDLLSILHQRWSTWLILLAGLLGLGAFLVFIWVHLDLYFVLTPFPPVPPGAMNIQHLEPGSLGGYRTLQFETAQPAEIVRQFYRTELPRRGWKLLCSPTQLEQPGCPLGLSPVVDLADAYTRDGDPSHVREINVSILKPGEGLVNSQNRLVDVVEYHYLKQTP